MRKVGKKVHSNGFWDAVTVKDLEDLRTELRTIIHHRQKCGIATRQPKVVDIAEDISQIETGRRSSSIPNVDMKAYEKQVEEVLIRLFNTDPTLKKIRRGEPVTKTELEALNSLVHTQNREVTFDLLKEFYDSAASLDFIIRSIVGMEPEAVRERFETFVHKHPGLTAKQTRFLSLLQNHIARYGSIEIERLYEDPFTVVDADGIDGVFPDEQADELINIINSFNPNIEQEQAPP